MLFLLAIVRLQNNKGNGQKGPVKYPNIYKWGNFGLSSVMVSTSLALAVRHFCVGRRLPNLHLSMPTAGPGTGLAHTGDAGLFGWDCVADIMLCCVLFEMQMRRWRSPLSFHHLVLIEGN